MPATISLPDFDLPTRSSSGFILRYIVPRLEPALLYGTLARKMPFGLVAPQSDVIIGTGHGEVNLYSGQREAIILQVGQYDPKDVKGKVIKLLSCLTAVQLGPDIISNGALCFMGYCVPGDTLIISNPVPTEIASINIGDRVLGYDGQFHKVTRTFARPYSGQMVEIIPYTMGLPIRMTPEHPVYVIPKRQYSGETLRPYRTPHRKAQREAWRRQVPIWLPAKELKEGDFLILPIMQCEEQEKVTLSISALLENIIVKNGIAYVGHKHWRNGKLVHTIGHGIRENLDVTPDFLRLMGYYISDGTLQKPSNKTIKISLNKREGSYAEDIRKIVETSFDFTPSIHSEKSTLTVSICARILGLLLEKLCGHGATVKKLPEWVMSLPKEFIYELIKGLWRGDGHYSKRNRAFIYSTTSKVLALQLSYLLLKIGIMPNLNPARQSGIGNHTLYRVAVYGYGMKLMSEILGEHVEISARPRGVAFVDDKNMYLPIRLIKTVPFNGLVHNISVEAVNSYICSVFTVHNCEDYTWILDADLSFQPWADEMAAKSLMPVVDGLNALLDGKMAGEAFQVELDGYLANATAETNELVKACIEFNHDHAVLLGDPNAKVRARPRISFPIGPPPLLISLP